MKKINAWIKALRLRTLPLAFSSIFMGAILATLKTELNIQVFIMCLITTIFLQILSNLANDYGDFISGVDNDSRKGPKRVIQMGLISQKEMKIGIFIIAFFSFSMGLILLLMVFKDEFLNIIFFLFLGITAIVAALKYTLGKNPYAYYGGGDFSVFIFFGLVGVCGSYFLFTHSLTLDIFLPASSIGFLGVGVLNINNIRDIISDKLAEKYSIPVKIGRINAIKYHGALLLFALVCMCVFVYFNYTSRLNWLFLIVTPLWYSNFKAVSKKEGLELDPYLRQLSMSTLLFVILVGLGFHI